MWQVGSSFTLLIFIELVLVHEQLFVDQSEVDRFS